MNPVFVLIQENDKQSEMRVLGVTTRQEEAERWAMIQTPYPYINRYQEFSSLNTYDMKELFFKDRRIDNFFQNLKHERK